MKFTRENTLNEILNYPQIKAYMEVLFSPFIISLFPKNQYDEKLKEVEKTAKTPWGEPFWVITDQVLSASNTILDITVNYTRKCIPLWNLEKGQWQPEDESKDEKKGVFLIAPTQMEAEREEGENRPAVIICPGGAYTEVCFGNEGHPIMERMEEAGYGTFILKYRVAPEKYPAPQLDLALAIKYVRAHAKEYHIDENNLLIMGFSAGGHLCALEAALSEQLDRLLQEELERINLDLAQCYKAFSAKPNKVALAYPVISLCEECHEGSANNLAGLDMKLREQLSVDKLVTKDYPQTFIWTCMDDGEVPPSNTTRMIRALDEAGVSYERNIYPSGGHGCGLAYTKEACTWSEEMIDFFK